MQPDNLLTSADREEALSVAYIQAVAAAAGYAVAKLDIDRDGVDCGTKAGGAMRPSVAIQLKAAIYCGDPVDGEYCDSLNRSNDDLLRKPAQTPRILVVLALPRSEQEWLQTSTGGRANYCLAIAAHDHDAPLKIRGDMERFGQLIHSQGNDAEQGDIMVAG